MYIHRHANRVIEYALHLCKRWLQTVYNTCKHFITFKCKGKILLLNILPFLGTYCYKKKSPKRMRPPVQISQMCSPRADKLTAGVGMHHGSSAYEVQVWNALQILKKSSDPSGVHAATAELCHTCVLFFLIHRFKVL